MEKHTQGTMFVRGRFGGPPGVQLVIDPPSKRYPENAPPVVATVYGARESEVRADAERLSAAWNAVQTIPTVALTPGSVKALIDAIKEALEIRDGEDCTCADRGNYVCPMCRLVEPLEAALAPFKGAQEVKPNAEV